MNGRDIHEQQQTLLARRFLEYSAGIPTPVPLGAVEGFDQLMARMDELGMERVFVKLAHSSSASGVVAFHKRADRLEAVTSTEIETTGGEVRLYNSLKIRRYTRLDEVRRLIDALAPHGVHVEQWLPKAALNGRVFDLRVVMIAGEPQHMVVRTSRGPLTNLHLGNRRGNLEEFLTALGPAGGERLRATCVRAARLLPRSMQMGLDILFMPGLRQHDVLEINAFGDLLPRVFYGGQDTYEAQVEAMLAIGQEVHEDPVASQRASSPCAAKVCSIFAGVRKRM